MLKKGSERIYIPYLGLKEGPHHFQFSVDDRFFEAYAEASEIHQGQVLVDVTLVREARVLVLDFHLTGTVRLICDRCLEPFNYSLDYTDTLHVKFGAVNEELEANVLSIREDEGVVKLDQFVYESIHLALPVRRTHGEDIHGNSTCNPEMVERLLQYEPHGEPKEEDSRWAALKELKNIN